MKQPQPVTQVTILTSQKVTFIVKSCNWYHQKARTVKNMELKKIFKAVIKVKKFVKLFSITILTLVFSEDKKKERLLLF